jgi:hypothetical protein
LCQLARIGGFESQLNRFSGGWGRAVQCGS